jgi:hypothetical protein
MVCKYRRVALKRMQGAYSRATRLKQVLPVAAWYLVAMKTVIHCYSSDHKGERACQPWGGMPVPIRSLSSPRQPVGGRVHRPPS